MWRVGALVFFCLAFMVVINMIQPAPCAAQHTHYTHKPIGPLERHPWHGQQHVEQTGRGDLFDVEYDRGHSGFLANANYKPPPFIAGMTAMHQDF
jgi:hypothetical protein